MGEVFTKCTNGETVQKGNSIIVEEEPPMKIVKVDSSTVSRIVVHPSKIEQEEPNIGTSQNKTNEIPEEQENEVVLQEYKFMNSKLACKNMNSFTDKGALLAKTLNLSYNDIQSKGIAILEEKSWDNLEELSISHNPIGDEGIRFFSKFTNIVKLQLENCSLTSEGLYILAKLELKKLNHLNLSSNKIGDDGIAFLEEFENLTDLYLENTGITIKGIQQLAEMKLDCLERLFLTSYEIGEQAENFQLVKQIEASRKIQIFY